MRRTCASSELLSTKRARFMYVRGMSQPAGTAAEL